VARFNVEIRGDDLGRALFALNGAGIPTISSGGRPGQPVGGRTLRSRFLRSTAFPILIVIVLAFLAQRVISPANETENAPSYDQFLAQVEQQPPTIAKVTLDPDDTSVEVVQVNGAQYEIGYPPRGEEALVNSLRRNRIETVVEETGRSGGSLLSWIVYLLPFALFGGFFVFLMRRMKEDRGSPGTRSEGLVPNDLKAVVEAESGEEATQLVRQALPAEGRYTLGKPKRLN
jgi:hypothetical protein